MDQKDLIRLLMILRKNGVTSYKSKDLELQLQPTQAPKAEIAPQAEPTPPKFNLAAQLDAISPVEPVPMPTDEQFLYWSTPDDIVASDPENQIQ
jgi:hypothetical protein